MGVQPERLCARIGHRLPHTEEYPTAAEQIRAEDELRWIGNIMRSNGIMHSKRQPA